MVRGRVVGAAVPMVGRAGGTDRPSRDQPIASLSILSPRLRPAGVVCFRLPMFDGSYSLIESLN